MVGYLYLNGPGNMDILGMRGHVVGLLEEDIWMFCNGRGSTAALGMRGHV